MQNIPTQETQTTKLSADEFNQVPSELENAITSTEQTLTASDLYQIAKAMATYAAGGDFYTDGGAVNAHVLSSIGNRRYPAAYSVGQRIRFIPVATNSSQTVTARVGTLAIHGLSKTVLANGGTPLVEVGDIAAGRPLTAVLTQTPDGLTTYWLTQPVTDSDVYSVSLTKLIAGGLDITVGNKRLQIRALGYIPSVCDIQIDNSDVDMHMDLTAETIRFRDETNDNHVAILTDYIEYAHTSKGTSDPVRSMRMQFSCPNTDWSVDPLWSGYVRTVDRSLTGIPSGTRIKSATISFDTEEDGYVCAPLSIQVGAYLGQSEITKMHCFTLQSPANAKDDSIIIDVEFDPTAEY